MSDLPLDLSVLESMFGDDDELLNEILMEFANSAEPYMLELDQAMCNSSADGVRSLAHKLKSSSRTVGAAELGDLSEKLEHSAPAGDWDSIKSQAQVLKAELDKVIDYIQSR